MYCKSLYPLPKFASKTQRLWVGNGQFVSILFIIPVIVDMHGHRFEIYTLVSEIHENVYLVLEIKNVFELEGVIISWDCCFNFLNRILPIFPKKHIVLKPKEVDQGKSTIYRWNIRSSNYQNTRWKYI